MRSETLRAYVRMLTGRDVASGAVREGSLERQGIPGGLGETHGGDREVASENFKK